MCENLRKRQPPWNKRTNTTTRYGWEDEPPAKTLQNVGFWRSSPSVFLINPTLVWVSLQQPWLFFFGDFSWFVPNMSTSPQDLTHFREISCCWSSCHFRELDSRTLDLLLIFGSKKLPCPKKRTSLKSTGCLNSFYPNPEVVTYCSIASVVGIDRCCLLDIMDTVQRLSCKELCDFAKRFADVRHPMGQPLMFSFGGTWKTNCC